MLSKYRQFSTSHVTFDLDLYWKCLYNSSMRDVSVIHLQCLVTLGKKMRKIAVLRE